MVRGGCPPRTSPGITRGFPRLCPALGLVAAVLLTLAPRPLRGVRLACLIHAANVHSEPGSNPSKWRAPPEKRPLPDGSRILMVAAGAADRGRLRPRRASNRPPTMMACAVTPRARGRPTPAPLEGTARCQLRDRPNCQRSDARSRFGPPPMGPTKPALWPHEAEFVEVAPGWPRVVPSWLASSVSTVRRVASWRPVVMGDKGDHNEILPQVNTPPPDYRKNAFASS